MKNLRQSPSPICLISHNTAHVHSDPEVSGDQGCTIPMQSSLFHSSPSQCLSFPSNTADKVSPIASSILQQQRAQTTTPSLQQLLTLPGTNISLQSYHLDLKKPQKLSPAPFPSRLFFFCICDHSCWFSLAVLPWATHFFELKCSKLYTAPAEASLMLNAVEGLFYMPCTASSTLYDPSMVSCLTL